MADISPYLFLWNDVASLTGTVDSDSEWVYVNATLTFNESLFPYGRGNIVTSDGFQRPGLIVSPYAPFEAGFGTLPQLFCRLPNPPYGARIIYTDDPTKPNAMTPIDPGNVGVDRNADFGLTGKYLGSQVRSSWVHKLSGYSEVRPAENETDFPPLVWETVKDTYPNGIRRQYEYDEWLGYVLAYNEETGAPIGWVLHDTVPMIWDPADTDQRVISRGGWTYLGFFGQSSPGMIIDFEMQWWNGPGFRCGDETRIITVD
jgi:hypothetical protein